MLKEVHEKAKKLHVEKIRQRDGMYVADGYTGRAKRNTRNRRKGRKRDEPEVHKMKKKITCYRCGVEGHRKAECFKTKDSKGKDLTDLDKTEIEKHKKMYEDKIKKDPHSGLTTEVDKDDDNGIVYPVSNRGACYLVEVTIDDNPVWALWDCGSEVSFMKESFAKKWNFNIKKNTHKLRGMASTFESKGIFNYAIGIGKELHEVQWKVYEGAPYDIVIGADLSMREGFDYAFRWSKPNKKGKRFVDLFILDSMVAQWKIKDTIRAKPARNPHELACALKELEVENNVLASDKELFSLASKAVALKKDEQQLLANLLLEHREEIPKEVKLFGQAKFEKFEIQLKPDAKQITTAQYRTTPVKTKMINDHMDDLESKGVAVREPSTYASPVFCIEKNKIANAGGMKKEYRVVADYRKLNEQTIYMSYPNQLTDTMLENLPVGTKVFSLIDLSSGYWQWPCSKRTGEITAIMGPRGTYRPKVLFMGLKNAVAKFQHKMTMVLKGYLGKFCDLHVDDIFVYSQNGRDHLDHLCKVFKRLKKYNLKAKYRKAVLGVSEIEVLGHKVSAQGTSVQEQKIEKVSQCPFPKNIGELRRFLGLAAYYRRFVKDYSKIVFPLTEMTKKNSRVVENNETCAAFEMIKAKLIERPC